MVVQHRGVGPGPPVVQTTERIPPYPRTARGDCNLGRVTLAHDASNPRHRCILSTAIPRRHFGRHFRAATKNHHFTGPCPNDTASTPCYTVSRMPAPALTEPTSPRLSLDVGWPIRQRLSRVAQALGISRTEALSRLVEDYSDDLERTVRASLASQGATKEVLDKKRRLAYYRRVTALKPRIQAAERDLIEGALIASNWVIARAARALSMPPTTLRDMVKRHPDLAKRCRGRGRPPGKSPKSLGKQRK